jgi:hypothetical protein
MLRRLTGLPLAVLLAFVAVPLSTAAADEKKKEDKKEDKADDKKPGDGDKKPAKDDDDDDDDKPKKKKKKDEAAPEPAKPELPPNDPTEDKTKTYYFVGARYQFAILPKYLLSLFVAGGPTTVGVWHLGIEGGMRKDGFETRLAFTYADVSTNEPFGFKGKNEDPNAWELVKSDLKLINAVVDFMWSTEFSKYVSFEYGMTVGLSAVIGDLSRVQARSKDGRPGETDPKNLEPCPGPQSGNYYCDGSNNHYPGDASNPSDTKNWYKEPSWFNGGSKPNLYARFGPALGFRFKPVKQFVGRVDLGYDLFMGVFFGVAANYGF